MLRAETDLVQELGDDMRLRRCGVERSLRPLWPYGPQIVACTMIKLSLGSKRVTFTERSAVPAEPVLFR
jgi:hypothetical protein